MKRALVNGVGYGFVSMVGICIVWPYIYLGNLNSIQDYDRILVFGGCVSFIIGFIGYELSLNSNSE